MALFAYKSSDAANAMSKIKHKHHHHESSDDNKVEEKLKLLTSKIDQLSSKFEKIEIRISKIESRLDDNEQKQTDDGFKDKVLKDLESIKEEMGKFMISFELKKWLNDTVECPQYYQLFIDNGIKDLSDVKLLNMERLKKMGIDDINDQMKLLNGVLKLNQAK